MIVKYFAIYIYLNVTAIRIYYTRKILSKLSIIVLSLYIFLYYTSFTYNIFYLLSLRRFVKTYMINWYLLFSVRKMINSFDFMTFNFFFSYINSWTAHYTRSSLLLCDFQYDIIIIIKLKIAKIIDCSHIPSFPRCSYFLLQNCFLPRIGITLHLRINAQVNCAKSRGANRRLRYHRINED